MKYSMRRHDARLAAALLSPLDRVEHLSTWGKVFAFGGAIWQYATTSAFSVALFLVLIAAIADYLLGVKASKWNGTYTPQAAHRGALGKMTGLLIAMLLRTVEYFILVQGLGDTKGMLATAVALSLFASDLQSIAHHRESFGAKPIPVLSSALEWIQRLAASRIPGPPDPNTPQRRAGDGGK